MLQTIDNIIQHNITFLVFGRLSDANFIELQDFARREASVYLPSRTVGGLS